MIKSKALLFIMAQLLLMNEFAYGQRMLRVELSPQSINSSSNSRNSKRTPNHSGRTAKSEPNANQNTVTFEIASHFLYEAGGSYVTGQPISLRSTFTNTGKNTGNILLNDHNDYSGTLPYPIGMAVRVWDASGTLLTVNEFDSEGWWSSYYYSASAHVEKPGDRIYLKPGQQVIRIVPLHIMLRGCTTLPNGLLPGRYTVQLSVHDLVSNKIEITVRG